MALGETLRKARMARKETASQVAAATRMKVQLVDALEQEDFSQIPAPIYAKGFIRLYAEHVGLDPDPLVRDYLQIREAPASAPASKKLGRTTPEKPREPAGDLFMRAGIAVPGDPATPEKNSAEPAPGRETRSEYPRKPDKNILRNDLERYAVSRGRPDRESDPRPKPIGAVSQTLESALLALRHGLDKLSAGQAALKAFFADIAWARLVRSPVKFAVLMVGALAIAVLILSGLSRLLRSGEARQPAQPRADTLILAADAPEPYFD